MKLKRKPNLYGSEHSILKSNIEYDYPLLKVRQSIPDTKESITGIIKRVVNPQEITRETEYLNYLQVDFRSPSLIRLGIREMNTIKKGKVPIIKIF